MRAHFEVAARHSTAYYGQLARARLGLSGLELQTPPEHASAASVELLRAAELLYAIGERDLVLSFLTGLAQQSDDAAGLASLASLPPAMTMPGRYCLSARLRSLADFLWTSTRFPTSVCRPGAPGWSG